MLFRSNPLPKVFEQGLTVRERLERRDDIQAPLLRQLKQEGATDYIVMPVVFSDGHIDALSVASDRAGGYSRADLARLKEQVEAERKAVEEAESALKELEARRAGLEGAQRVAL